jgi:hypothetical protein
VRWWRRLLAFSIRGSFERAALRILSVAVASATAVLLLVVAASVVPRVLIKFQQNRLDGRWTESVDAPAEILERVTPRGSSMSALRLDRAAAAFGVDLVPGSNPGRIPDAAPPLAYNPELSSWCDAVMAGSGGSRDSVPETVKTTLRNREEALTEIIASLTDDERVVWELHNAMGGGSRVPSPGQLLKLHRWLAAAAADGLDRGDEQRALASLDASWRLNQETLHRPESEMRLAGYSALELSLAMLRPMSRSVVTDIWLPRLDGLDPVERLDGWVLIEAYSLPASEKNGTLLDEDGFWPLVLSLTVEPARRWLLLSASESLRVGTAAQAAADLTTLDPDLQYVDAHHRIPRWNRVARAALPNPWREWLPAARAGLAVELAAEVLRLESANAEQVDGLVAQLPQRRPSRVSGAVWMWTAEPEGLRIRLVIEGAPSSRGRRLSNPPLEHVFDPTRFPSENTDVVGTAPDAAASEGR